MTSESNKKLPVLKPKEVIGTKRRPNRRDLKNRNDLRGLPDPDSEVMLRRAALNVEQAALKIRQAAIEESSMRASLRVLADPETASWSDSDWETMTVSSAGMEEGEEKAMEDAFIAKVRGVEVGQVEGARTARGVVIDMPAFVKKVRAVQGRVTRSAAAATVVGLSPPLPSPPPPPPPPPAASAASASARVQGDMQPGTTRRLTAAQAALAATNSQAGTNVTMEELRTVMDIEDEEEMYDWTVGSINTRELTVAEAALIFTNMQAGTNVTMQDLRTAREMVDLWDNADIYQWTVGNFE